MGDSVPLREPPAREYARPTLGPLTTSLSLEKANRFESDTMMKSSVIYPSILGAILLLCSCQSTPRDPGPIERFPPRGHAHNDYEHETPLMDALSHGFSSVEADIHLVDGALLVAHDADEVQVERTLEALYLEPLRQRFLSKNGIVSSGNDAFILLIDIKTNAEETYQALEMVLQKYQSMLTKYSNEWTLQGSVTVILSGNRPTQKVAEQASRLVAIDGRLPDLSNGHHSPHLVPLISDNWKSHFSWRGSGPISPLESEKLKSIVTRAHEQGRLIRFWGNPDIPEYWNLARSLQIDLINTDKLEGLSSFLELTE